jgi:ribosomal protein L32
MSMRCVRCAIDHPDDKRLCMACGDPLASTDETTPPFPRCSNCGETVSATDHFCPGCGTRHGDEPLAERAASAPPTREFVLCPACGGHASLTDRICDVCGADLSRDQPPGDSYEALFAILLRRDEKRRERHRAIFRAVSGLVVALLLALGVNAYRSRGGSAAVAPMRSATPQLAISQRIGQVATADDIGIRIVGAGAAKRGRSEADIRHGVEQHFAELQQSYLIALEADSTAEGVVTLHMTLAADGTVAYVRSTPLGLADRGFVTIVERQAAAWRFVPSEVGLVSVHYPLIFHLPTTDPHELVTRLRESSGPVVGGEGRARQATQLYAGASWSGPLLGDRTRRFSSSRTSPG